MEELLDLLPREEEVLVDLEVPTTTIQGSSIDAEGVAAAAAEEEGFDEVRAKEVAAGSSEEKRDWLEVVDEVPSRDVAAAEASTPCRSERFGLRTEVSELEFPPTEEQDELLEDPPSWSSSFASLLDS